MKRMGFENASFHQQVAEDKIEYADQLRSCVQILHTVYFYL
jgi:hypothetical protein